MKATIPHGKLLGSLLFLLVTSASAEIELSSGEQFANFEKRELTEEERSWCDRAVPIEQEGVDKRYPGAVYFEKVDGFDKKLFN